MKTLYKFILFFIIITPYSKANAQNRKSIIREIKEYKDSLYLSSYYPTSEDTLKWVIYDYLEKLNYKVQKEESNYLEFAKIKRTHHANLRTKSLVYINILPRGLLKVVKLESKEINHPYQFSGKIEPYQLHINKFDKIAFYQYLFLFFIKDDITLPKKLQEKINKFNSEQTKSSKQIIKGRDY